MIWWRRKKGVFSGGHAQSGLFFGDWSYYTLFPFMKEFACFLAYIAHARFPFFASSLCTRISSLFPTSSSLSHFSSQTPSFCYPPNLILYDGLRTHHTLPTSLLSAIISLSFWNITDSFVTVVVYFAMYLILRYLSLSLERLDLVLD